MARPPRDRRHRRATGRPLDRSAPKLYASTGGTMTNDGSNETRPVGAARHRLDHRQGRARCPPLGTSDLRCSGQPHPRARRGLRRPARRPAGARLVRGAPRRPRGRGGLHLAAEFAAPRMDDACAPGRQARPVREAVLHPRSGRPRGLRPRRGVEARAVRGLHVAAPSRRQRRCARRSRSSASCRPSGPPSRSQWAPTARPTSAFRPISRAAH